MKEIRVYVVNLDEFEFGDARLMSISNEKFMEIAEKCGSVYSLKGFEYDFNYDFISSHNCFIRFIEVECEESINFEEWTIPTVSLT